MLEPIGAATIEALMNRLPNEALEGSDALPNRKVDDDAGVGIGPSLGGVAALVDLPPDEPFTAFRDAVHQSKVVCEIGHARIVDVVSDTPDVQLGKMVIGRLLHCHTLQSKPIRPSRRK